LVEVLNPTYIVQHNSCTTAPAPGNFAVSTKAVNWQANSSEKSDSRSLNEPSDADIVEKTETIVFEDTSTVITQRETFNFENLYSVVNPYTDCTPKEIVERVVSYPTLTWNGSSTNIFVADPLTTIVSTSPTILNILGDLSGVQANWGMFRFMRCSFKAQVRINSTQYHQGTLLVGWLPANLPVTQIGTQSALAHNCVVLSASQQDSCTIDIPYYSRKPHYDLFAPEDLPVLFIKAQHPLLASNPSIVDSVPISLFLSCVNVKLYGILPQQTAVSLRGKTLHDPKAGLHTGPLFETHEVFEKQAAVNKKMRNTEAQEKRQNRTIWRGQSSSNRITTDKNDSLLSSNNRCRTFNI